MSWIAPVQRDERRRRVDDLGGLRPGRRRSGRARAVGRGRPGGRARPSTSSQTGSRTRSRRSASRSQRTACRRGGHRAGRPSRLADGLGAVVAQEQLLERRRLALQRCDAERLERGEQPAQRRRCRPRRRTRVPSTARSCTPGRRVQAGRRRSSSSARTEVRVRCRSSASVPVSTVRPARMMLTRSQSASTSARMWLDSSTVRPWPCSSADALAEHLLHQRVQAGGRLVQQEQLDVGGERGDQRDLLPVALGVRPAFLVGSRSKRSSSSARRARVQPAAQPAEQVDHLAAGQVRPQRHVAGHVRQPAVQRRSRPPRVAAEQPDGAGVGAQQPEQDPERRGLAGAVRAEEAVHLAGADVQVEPVQRPGPRRTS